MSFYRAKTRRGTWPTIAVAAALPLAAVASAPAKDASTRAAIERFCFDCHSGETLEAGLDLEELLAVRPVVRQRDEWRRVAQVIELRSMPPEGAEQPGDDQRQWIAKSINQTLDEFDYRSVSSAGHEPARRLTHREYNNTLRDLLGVDLRPADRFPRELTGPTGFDNDASTLFLQPALMERYIATAERVVNAALPERGEGQVPPPPRNVLLRGNSPDALNDQVVERLLRRFLLRAHRRPPSGSDLAQTNEAYQAARDAGAKPYEAFKSVLPGVLISPRFLLRSEKSPAGHGLSPIDDWELATRLSYFLWSSMPDEELLRLAHSGKLSRPEVLRAQVARLIEHKKFDEFGAAFGGQWLSTKLVGREVRRDPIDEPWCTDSLMEAMRGETEQMIVWLVRQDRPATELLTADYSFINEELARTLYKIRDVKGAELRKVSLVGSGRRGILGHAAVLAVTSNYGETSPVKRGAYVLETLLGCPPPPPPPNVSEFRDDLADNDRLTFAEKLGRHAADQRCSSCHSRIDPLGFALERYKSFGRLRRGGSRRQIAAAPALPDGTKVGGAKALVRHLLEERRSDFVRNLVEKTLQYALGRSLDYRDEQGVRDLIAKWEDDGLGAKQLIVAITASNAFRMHQTEKNDGD